MPLIRSAIKKQRQDKKRTIVAREKKEALKKVVKTFDEKPTSENLTLVFSALDRAAKTGLLPKGRVDRKKSRLSLKIKEQKASTPKTSKKPSSTKKVKSVVK
ncbi:MAG TPA: 30S ribosomal protein S20 [Candidatus Saccharimonadales bacterium]|nr:30S ribosomal protein S20 [Candidatus Saccharimonadales bacterium]